MPVTEDNRDTGSLDTGPIEPRVGDRVLIAAEAAPRTVTYVMGSPARGWHACFRGQGAVPRGRVEWDVVERSQGAAPSLRPDEPLHVDGASDAERTEER